MKFLLFDQKAIDIIVNTSYFQSIEYLQGARFIEHICGNLQSEILGNLAIEYYTGGILFVGKRNITINEELNDNVETNTESKIFCIDLTACDILTEKDRPSDLMTVLQKSFRTVMRIWNRQPFTVSERIHGSKSIVFPFVMTDRRRMVIERSNDVPRLTKRGINFTLLAYKYNGEDAPQYEEIADTRILREAGEIYYNERNKLQKKFVYESKSEAEVVEDNAFAQITASDYVGGGGFIFFDFKTQYRMLTETQRFIVDYPNLASPLRVDGAAGTGKTMSLVMRAYKLLTHYKEIGASFSVVFFAHNESTNRRNREIFELYSDSKSYLDRLSAQNIRFVTLLEFCREFTEISVEAIVEKDAGDAKTYQLMLIENVIEKAEKSNKLRTYIPLLSQDLCDVFNNAKTSRNTLYTILQHEFSIQIKGRTDCTIDTYYDIPSISNGLPCKNKKDKEFVFSLFNDYQNELKVSGSYDVDDVVIEALSRLNAPVWRRVRAQNGFDYIIVDEMHLFNINEQSIFHHLTKNIEQKEIPICFALDYSQAIGDRGNTRADYIEKAFGSKVEKRNYHTIFRNSPQISRLCASIAASGALMFQEAFSNPYNSVQSNFTEHEESNSSMPVLHMYNNDEDMLESLSQHIDNILKELHCKPNEIAVISFDPKITVSDGVDKLDNLANKQFALLDLNITPNAREFILASPYAINGLEFKATILVGVDEGRIPQTSGVSDISKHFINYSAYNLLYLASSRAKYRIVFLGNKLNGISSCLEHSIKSGYLDIVEH